MEARRWRHGVAGKFSACSRTVGGGGAAFGKVSGFSEISGALAAVNCVNFGNFGNTAGLRRTLDKASLDFGKFSGLSEISGTFGPVWGPFGRDF